MIRLSMERIIEEEEDPRERALMMSEKEQSVGGIKGDLIFNKGAKCTEQVPMQLIALEAINSIVLVAIDLNHGKLRFAESGV
jgi:hypothetical protein